jgi:ribokinase
VSPPPVGAVDTTGAGDVFAAACLCGLLRREDPARILVWAAAAGAALSARGREAGMPGIGEIDSLAGTSYP